MQTTEVVEVVTNIGIRREDLFDLLIVNTQEYADELRRSELAGDF